LSGAITFQGGTLVLYDVEDAPPPFQIIKGRPRCEAYHYPRLIEWIRETGLRDNVPRWQTLNLKMHDDRPAHDYQIAALDAWDKADRRGSIVLPTGAGKTFVAIHAIQRVGRSALVVAPTIDLLHQWYARLVNAFEIDVGVYYGGEKIVLPITVTTYHSAGDVIAAHGDAFKVIIFDEVHHLPAPSWGEAALMSPSPFRLGLTATYPEDHEQEGTRWRVEDLIGGIVFALKIDDLTGDTLAEYRTQRVRVDLTPDERKQYDDDYAIYAGYFRQHQLVKTHGKFWLNELMRRGSFDVDARAAHLARQRIIALLAGCEGKLEALEKLLREYSDERCLIFTENNAVVYAIARKHLIPALTHETKAAERKHILEAFSAGEYHAVATSKVLNEGVDVPEAKIAIVLGGTSSAREYIQRLGRVLRKSGNREALLFEVIARDTIDVSRAQRRRPQNVQR